MTDNHKCSPIAKKSGDKAAKKSARDERLKQSLRANLQRRKAKMRALKSTVQSESDEKSL